MPNPEPNYVHPRSAVAVRRAGARLTAVDPQNPPHTYGPSGVVPSPKAARGIIVYIGLDESKASADGTSLSAIAGELQAYAKELASQAETQAVIALAGVAEHLSASLVSVKPLIQAAAWVHQPARLALQLPAHVTSPLDVRHVPAPRPFTSRRPVIATLFESFVIVARTAPRADTPPSTSIPPPGIEAPLFVICTR